MSANAEAASAAVAARQAEQLGVSLALYNQKKNVVMPQVTTSMPPTLYIEPLDKNDSYLRRSLMLPTRTTKTPNNAMDAALREEKPSNA